MPRAATVQRDDEQTPAERAPGQFARHPKTGAPWVADPTKTSKWGLKKAELIALCANRRIPVPDKVTVAQLEELLGPRPTRVQYGRPSSLGKQIENTTNLQKWSERAVALGLWLDGGPESNLIEPAWLDLLDLPPDQWNLDDPNARDVLDTIAVKAKNRAQAGIAAERGTHGHELTEDFDTEVDIVARITRGEELGLSAEVQYALVAAWEKALQLFGFEILGVEATCVDDVWRQAGTLDRIVRLSRDVRFVTALGEIVVLEAGWVGILDIKTGKLRIDEATGFLAYWHAYAVQLASYAQSKPYDPDTDTRGEWPWSIDQRWAIIAHLDIGAALEGEAVCRLVLVDLEAGRHAGALCVAAREWEKRTDVFSIVTDDLAVSVPVASLEEGAGSADSAVEPVSRHTTPVTAAATSDPPPPIAAQDADPPASSPTAQPEQTPGGGGAPSARRRALLDRYQALSDVDRRRFCARNVDGDDLDAVERLLEEIEGTAEGRRVAILCGPAGCQRVVLNPPRPITPDEGDPVADLGPLFRAYAALDPDAKGWVDSLVAAGRAAGVGWSPNERATVRRFELGRGAVRLASSWRHAEDGPHQCDCTPYTLNDIVRGLLGEATGREEVEQESLPLGAAIGSLNAAEAVRFAQLADEYLALGATA